MAQQKFSLGVVILAAGASTRMGRPKMLLPWGQTTVLGHEVGVWRKAGAAQIAVAMASGDARIDAELDRIDFPRKDRVVNPDPGRGMFSSIQCAAQSNVWNDGLTHFAIVLGDQPHLKPETLWTLIDFSTKNPDKICQPRFQGSARHPVILPRDVFSEIASTKHPTLRDFLNSIPEKCEWVRVDDPGLELDMDQPADYEKAIRLARSEP